jgi:hypothetical protein
MMVVYEVRKAVRWKRSGGEGRTRRNPSYLSLESLDPYTSRAFIQPFLLSFRRLFSPSSSTTTLIAQAFLPFLPLSNPPSSPTTFSPAFLPLPSPLLSFLPSLHLRPSILPRSTRVRRGRLNAGGTLVEQGRSERSGRWSAAVPSFILLSLYLSLSLV